MELQVAKGGEVILKVRHNSIELAGRYCESVRVAEPLYMQRFAGLGNAVPVVKELDRLLESDGDEQADDDGGWTMVTMWMKKSLQVWRDRCGACTSSMGSEISGVERVSASICTASCARSSDSRVFSGSVRSAIRWFIAGVAVAFPKARAAAFPPPIQ